jgi:phosphoketolase
MAAQGTSRITANPHANGGLLRKPLDLPDFRDYAVKVEKPGQIEVSPTERPRLTFCATSCAQHDQLPRLRPDETASNKLDAIYEGSHGKTWMAEMQARGRRRRLPLARRPRHGDALRAHARRLVRRLRAHRPARLLFEL